MYKVRFQNIVDKIDREEKIMGIYDTEEECNAAIVFMIKTLGFNSPYWRCLQFENGYVIDFGSYSKFVSVENGD